MVVGGWVNLVARSGSRYSGLLFCSMLLGISFFLIGTIFGSALGGSRGFSTFLVAPRRWLIVSQW